MSSDLSKVFRILGIFLGINERNFGGNIGYIWGLEV